MGTQAPAVVALVVACGPARWLDETLESLASQDYPNLSVLVVAPDGALAARAAARLPDAHFALVKGDFAEAANRGMEMVGGAAHVLVCHGDVVLAPSAVRLLVEEAYRSNAGLTCPKLVSWRAPERLLSVGMTADRLGKLHPLVEPGELDQGQHDAVREVFVAPGGALLVRSDLWRALGGYLGSGADLDLSWRAQLAGARVVVAPQAVVRHREACSEGTGTASAADAAGAAGVAGAPGAAGAAGSAGSAGASGAAAEAQRLRVLWTCYGRLALLVVVPAVVLAAPFESAWRLLARRAGPAVPVIALAMSLASPKKLLDGRRRAQSLRRVSDLSLSRSRRGSAHLQPALLRLPLVEAAGARARRSAPSVADSDGSCRLPWGWPAAVGVAVLALLIAGSRDLLTGSIPHVGLLPTGGVGISSWLRAWWSGPGTPGLGGASFGPPGLLFMGLLGALCFGAAGLAAHILVLGPLVLGPLGAYFGARQFGSQRGQLAAGVVYAALPLPYNAVAQGHFGGLVGYAAMPWLLAGLSLASTGVPWRRVARLAVVLGVAAAFAPTMLVAVLVVGAALTAGSLLAGGGDRLTAGSLLAGAGDRLMAPLLAAAGMVAGAFVLLLPWSLRLALSSPGGQRIGLGHLLGLQTGPYGGGLTWAVLAAAGVSLFIGRGSRLVWAVRLWAVVFASFAIAWAWSPAGGLELLLAPAGAALASLVALGAASVEADLSGYRFGWRQFAPAFGIAAALTTVLPFFSWVSSGRFDLPTSGAEAAYAFPTAAEPYRVLWVGPPGSLPLASQGISGGLAFAASLDGVPNNQLWAVPPSRLQAAVGEDLAWAESGETTGLGHLLALAGVRYVVVPAGSREAGVLTALGRQVDLSQVGINPAYAVYANSAWLPVFFAVPAGAAADQFAIGALAGTQWVAAYATLRHQVAPLPAASARSGDLLYGAVPPGTWRVAGASARTGPLGTVLWTLPSAHRARAARATAQPTPAGTTGNRLAAVFTLVLWVATLWVASRRQRQRVASPAPVPEEEAEELVLVAAGEGA